MSSPSLSGEVSNSKLSAVFMNRGRARAAADEMIAELSLQPSQVKLISKDSTDVGIQLQPEGGGIWRTLVRAHVRLGIAGALLGLAAFAAMWALDIPFVVRSPAAAASVALGFGALGGLMLGGLVTLRPDQDAYIHRTREAVAEGRTAVVVHAVSADQHEQAARFLSAQGAEVTRSL